MNKVLTAVLFLVSLGAIKYIMKNGRLYNGSNLDEVFPTPRKAEKFWWQTVRPVELPGLMNK